MAVLQPGNVPLIDCTLTFCPAVPLHVSRPFCPGVVKFKFTGDPPGVIVPTVSATEYTLTVSDPVFDPG
jgi:hypothetical protein